MYALDSVHETNEIHHLNRSLNEERLVHESVDREEEVKFYLLTLTFQVEVLAQGMQKQPLEARRKAGFVRRHRSSGEEVDHFFFDRFQKCLVKQTKISCLYAYIRMHF